jgi:hypothetical protein
MAGWLDFARGPVFLFAFSFMVLGLLRHFLLTAWAVSSALRRVGNKQLSLVKIAVVTLNWIIPVRRVKEQLLLSVTSVLFYIVAIIVPVFLGGHIALWTRGIGVSWPALSPETADTLTLVAIVTAIALVLQRAVVKTARSSSRSGNFASPLLIAVPFASGYLMMHPAINPFSYDGTFLVHMMSANLIFVLIPLTRLSHRDLIPRLESVAEVARRWPAEEGNRAEKNLGKEDVPI